MTHATDCGRQCRCCDPCCIRPSRIDRVAICVCQTCRLNADHAPPPRKSPENPVRPTHPTHRHLPSLDAVRYQCPEGDGFCRYCYRLMPLNRLVGGDTELVLPAHKRGNGSSTLRCPGSGQPPVDGVIPEEVPCTASYLEFNAPGSKTWAEALADALAAITNQVGARDTGEMA